MRRLVWTAALAGIALAASPALAHHSGAMFDRTKKVTITGVVSNFEYVQPHSWIDVRTTTDGKEVTWAFEGGAPGQMRSVGLTPQTLHAGDRISITGYPLRDGRTGGAFVELTLPNGKRVTTGRAVVVPTP
jgi:hypothetical protein